MTKRMHRDDKAVLTIMQAALARFRDSTNAISDEYPEDSQEALLTGEVGSRLNTVLVALDQVLEDDPPSVRIW